jgi:hypothetical protein
MSFDRAGALHMGVCQILNDPDAGVTNGERAIAYASLAQVEAIVSLAALIQRAFPEAAGEEQLSDIERGLAFSAGKLVDRIVEDPRDF